MLVADLDPTYTLTKLFCKKFAPKIENHPMLPDWDGYFAKQHDDPSVPVIKTIRDALDPVIEDAPFPLTSASVITVVDDTHVDEDITGCVKLIAGSPIIDDYTDKVSFAFATSGSQCKNAPGALQRVLDLTAAEHDIDFILLDLGGSTSALNKVALMGSDFFLVPCAVS